MAHAPLQKKLLGAATLLLAGALTAGTALAQPGPGRFGRGIRAAMATLDLSDVQKDKVKSIFASHKGGRMAFHAQARADREALKAAASAANPDPAVVGAAFLKVRDDGKAMKAQLEGLHAEINAVLTPEQRAKLDGWIAAHRQQRRMLRGGPQPN